MKRTAIFGIAAAFLLIGIVAAASAVSANGRGTSHKGPWENANTTGNPGCMDGNFSEHMKQMESIRTQLDSAIESGDYDAWYAIASTTKGPMNMTSKINKDNFGKYVELYNARKKVMELSEELDLGSESSGSGLKGPGFGGYDGISGDMRGPGMGRERMQRTQQQQDVSDE